MSTAFLRACLAAAGAVVLSGCVAFKLPPPSPSAANIEILRAANLRPSAAGKFSLAVGKPADMDRTLQGLRGSSLSPEGGSFAVQLRDVIVTELKAAGAYDEKSSIVISGQLTDSMVDASIGTGKARLAARFTVTRDGKAVYDKELAAGDSWKSVFVGAEAIPDAVNRYSSLYRQLAGQLFTDPDFRTAIK